MLKEFLLTKKEEKEEERKRRRRRRRRACYLTAALGLLRPSVASTSVACSAMADHQTDQNRFHFSFFFFFFFFSVFFEEFASLSENKQTDEIDEIER